MKDNWKKQFVIIYLGQAFSILGSAAVQFAIIWWLTSYTESAITLTTATIVGFLPNMIIGPFAGVFIDKYNRKIVMIWADILIAISSLILGIAFLVTSVPPIWFIYLILFIRGVGGTFHSPAMQAAIPMLVPTDMLTKVGGWSNLITSVSTMLGPVLGAGLMGILPIFTIMLVDIIGAIFAVVCLFFVKIPDIPKSGENVHLLSDIKEGIKVMRSNKPLMAIFLPMILCNVIYMPLGALFPLFVLMHFNGDAISNSIVEFVFSGGLLISSLIMGIMGGRKKRFLIISLAVTALGVTTLISGLLPGEGYWIFVVCCFVMGATGTFINVPLMAYTQETVEPSMLGKVFSFLMTAMSFAMPIGLIIAGPLSEYIGVNMWFFYSGIGIILTGVICFFMTRRYDEA